jgi:hypothetical protein
MTTEENLKLYIGELVIQIAKLNAEKSALEERLIMLEKDQTERTVESNGSQV